VTMMQDSQGGTLRVCCAMTRPGVEYCFFSSMAVVSHTNIYLVLCYGFLLAFGYHRYASTCAATTHQATPSLLLDLGGNLYGCCLPNEVSDDDVQL
jgi:hypothetical protein